MYKLKRDIENHSPEELGLYVGVYPATVEAVGDGENGLLYQIKVKCVALYGEDVFEKWINPVGGLAGNRIGLFFMPNVGDRVYVMCQQNDPNYPIWFYGSWVGGEVPEDTLRGSIVLQSTTKYRMEMNDQNKFFLLKTPYEQEIKLTENQNIHIKNSSQEAILDKANDTIKLKQGNQEITINGNNIILIKNGNTLIQLNANNIQISNGTESMLAILSNLVDLIMTSPIATMLGPQLFINQTAWAALKTRIQNFLV